MDDLQHTFDRYAHQLDSKAAQLKQGTQILKAGGVSSALLGAIGLAGTGLGIVPLALGLSLYGFAAMREKTTTGRFMPIPFSQSSGASMAAGAIQENIEAANIPITDFDYLSQDDRADYTLFGIMAPVIIPLLSDADDVQAERWLTQARRSLLKHHVDLINDPELLAPALYGSIAGARGAFAASLPDDLQERLSPAVLSAATERRSFDNEDPIDVEVERAITPTPPLPETAYSAITRSPFRSRFFLGGQRTGKSRLAVGSAAAAKADGAEIYYINLASWGSEDDGYAATADVALTANIQALSPEHAAAQIESAIAVLQRFYLSDKPAILVLEEWAELGSKNHQHAIALEPFLTRSASIVEQLANTGQKRRKAIYATGPMFVAGSLQQATKAAKSMELVLVAIAPGKAALWQGQSLTFSAPVYAMALNNWYGVIEPTGDFDDERIALVDGQWRAIGQLPPLPKQSSFAAIDRTPATAPPLSQSAQWDALTAELRADGDSSAAVVDWLSSTSKESFSPRDARANKQLRHLTTDEIRAVFDRLCEEEWLRCIEAERYQLAQPI